MGLDKARRVGLARKVPPAALATHAAVAGLHGPAAGHVVAHPGNQRQPTSPVAYKRIAAQLTSQDNE